MDIDHLNGNGEEGEKVGVNLICTYRQKKAMYEHTQDVVTVVYCMAGYKK